MLFVENEVTGFREFLSYDFLFKVAATNAFLNTHCMQPRASLIKCNGSVTAASEDLREMLKNPELQKIIRKIDSSSDAQKVGILRMN